MKRRGSGSMQLWRPPVADPIAATALIGEAAIGYPGALYRLIGHPVGWFARLIGLCERNWNIATRSGVYCRIMGVVTMLIVIASAAGGALLIEHGLRTLLPRPYDWIAIAIAAIPGLAQRSLHDHVTPVLDALRRNDLSAARTAVGMIIGRDVAVLDTPGVTRAATESLAESFCDGVVAPAFWLIIGGLPGLYAYKAINTADSLIGHKEPQFRTFGWAAARIDDLANLLPARLGGILLCIAGLGGWRTMWRDARLHASPNAGWPEAAMAGALSLRLAGPIAYDGIWHDKPWLGDGRADATADDLARALGIYRRACVLLWLIAGGVAWLL